MKKYHNFVQVFTRRRRRKKKRIEQKLSSEIRFHGVQDERWLANKRYSNLNINSGSFTFFFVALEFRVMSKCVHVKWRESISILTTIDMFTFALVIFILFSVKSLRQQITLSKSRELLWISKQCKHLSQITGPHKHICIWPYMPTTSTIFRMYAMQLFQDREQISKYLSNRLYLHTYTHTHTRRTYPQPSIVNVLNHSTEISIRNVCVCVVLVLDLWFTCALYAMVWGLAKINIF